MEAHFREAAWNGFEARHSKGLGFNGKCRGSTGGLAHDPCKSVHTRGYPRVLPATVGKRAMFAVVCELMENHALASDSVTKAA